VLQIQIRSPLLVAAKEDVFEGHPPAPAGA